MHPGSQYQCSVWRDVTCIRFIRYLLVTPRDQFLGYLTKKTFDWFSMFFVKQSQTSRAKRYLQYRLPEYFFSSRVLLFEFLYALSGFAEQSRKHFLWSKERYCVRFVLTFLLDWKLNFQVGIIRIKSRVAKMIAREIYRAVELDYSCVYSVRNNLKCRDSCWDTLLQWN